MKRSRQVPASLIVAVAASLTVGGCGSSYYDQCVDSMGRVLSDNDCRSGRIGAHWIRRNVESGGFGSTGSGGFFGG